MVVTIGAGVDVYAFAARDAWKQVTGEDNPFAENMGESVRQLIEASIRDGLALHEMQKLGIAPPPQTE